MKYVIAGIFLLAVALLLACIIVFMVLNIIDMWNSMQEDISKYEARKDYEEFKNTYYRKGTRKDE